MPYTEKELEIVKKTISHSGDADYLLDEAYTVLFNCDPAPQHQITRDALLHAIQVRHNQTVYEHG
jgi:hypothetical protein